MQKRKTHKRKREGSQLSQKKKGRIIRKRTLRVRLSAPPVPYRRFPYLFEHILHESQSEGGHIVQIQHAFRHLTLGLQIRVHKLHHTGIRLLDVHVFGPLYVATHNSVLALLQAHGQLFVCLVLLRRRRVNRLFNLLATLFQQFCHLVDVRCFGELHFAQSIADLRLDLVGKLGFVQFLDLGVMVRAPALLAKELGAQSPIRVDFAFKKLLVAHSAGGSVQNDESGGAVEQHAVFDFGCVAAVVFADFHEAVEGVFGLFDFQKCVELLFPCVFGGLGSLSLRFRGFICGCVWCLFLGGCLGLCLGRCVWCCVSLWGFRFRLSWHFF